jgi:hypothetical protein
MRHDANHAAGRSIPATGVMPFRRKSSAVPAAREYWMKLKDFFIFSLAILSLGAAGSDGPFFPWVNISGALVFAAIVLPVIQSGRKNHQRGNRSHFS